MVLIMEQGVFRSSEIRGRTVCEGCSYVTETRRTVVEACSIAFDNWCSWEIDELRLLCESSETRGFYNADKITGSHSVSGYFSHSRATHTPQYRQSQERFQSKIFSEHWAVDSIKTSRIHEPCGYTPFGERFCSLFQDKML